MCVSADLLKTFLFVCTAVYSWTNSLLVNDDAPLTSWCVSHSAFSLCKYVCRYPVKGYLPLQDPPHLVLRQSAFLVQCMDRLVFYEPPDDVKVGPSFDHVNNVYCYMCLRMIKPKSSPPILSNWSLFIIYWNSWLHYWCVAMVIYKCKDHVIHTA